MSKETVKEHLLSIRKIAVLFVILSFILLITFSVGNMMGGNVAVNKETGMDVKLGGDIEERIGTGEEERRVTLKAEEFSNVAYEFLFSNNEPVGYVMFYGVNDEVSYSISLNTADTYGYYFDFLDNHRSMSFIVLTDGFKSYFLSEDNVLYNASTGNEVDKIEVEGDCYQALNGSEISVSYEKIVNEIELLQK